MSLNKIYLETDGLVVGVNQLVASGNGINVGNNLVVQGNAYMNNAQTNNMVTNSVVTTSLTTNTLNLSNSLIISNGQITLSGVPFYEAATNVSSNYTITTGMNAFSPGPITINSGIIVTVPLGSTWTVT